MNNLHDIPGTHDVYVSVEQFGTADDGEYRVVFVAPYSLNLMALDAWFDAACGAGGTASGSADFGLVASLGTAANSISGIATVDVMGGTAGGATRHADRLTRLPSVSRWRTRAVQGPSTEAGRPNRGPAS